MEEIPDVRPDGKDKQTLTIISILIGFVLIVAITAFVVLYLRKKKQIVEGVIPGEGDDEANELAPIGNHERHR